jgi:hypothetical protein
VMNIVAAASAGKDTESTPGGVARTTGATVRDVEPREGAVL